MRMGVFLAASLGLAVFIVVVGLGGVGPPPLRAFAAALAVATWSSFVLPLRGLPALPGWFRLRDWERTGRLYRLLGVRAFRRLVRRGPFAIFNHRLRAAWRDHDVARMERETCFSETVHLVAFVVVLGLALMAALRGEAATARWLVVFDVPLNLYPVLLQRDHRARIVRLHERPPLEHA